MCQLAINTENTFSTTNKVTNLYKFILIFKMRCYLQLSPVVKEGTVFEKNQIRLIARSPKMQRKLKKMRRRIGKHWHTK